MSQVSWQQPGENENQNLPASREAREKSRYEGFEGMNYEQKRRPYNPAGSNPADIKKLRGEGSKAPNEA